MMVQFAFSQFRDFAYMQLPRQHCWQNRWRDTVMKKYGDPEQDIDDDKEGGRHR